MNKFSLLFIVFIFVGGVVASDAGDVQKQEGSRTAEGDVSPIVKKEEAPIAGEIISVPAPAPVEQDKEASSLSKIDKLKFFLGGVLFQVKKAGFVAKHYILGDFFINWIAKKGYIANPDAGLINAYINGVTPRRIANYAILIALVNVAYFGYKSFVKDQDQDDFCLDDEDLY